jgi:hypothetical protein
MLTKLSFSTKKLSYFRRDKLLDDAMAADDEDDEDLRMAAEDEELGMPTSPTSDSGT